LISFAVILLKDHVPGWFRGCDDHIRASVEHHTRNITSESTAAHFLPAAAADVPRSPPPVHARGRHLPPPPTRARRRRHRARRSMDARTLYSMHSSVELTTGRRRVLARARARRPRAALASAIHVRRPRPGCPPSAVALVALSGALSLSLSSLHTRPLAFRVPGQSSTAVARAHQSAPPSPSTRVLTHRAPSPSPSSPSPPPSHSRSPLLSTRPPRVPCSRARVWAAAPVTSGVQSHFHANLNRKFTADEASKPLSNYISWLPNHPPPQGGTPI
jgi:hypothetical protein